MSFLRRLRLLLPLSVVAVIAIVLVSACGSGPPQQQTGRRCAACGMDVDGEPEWIARIDYTDGSSDFFDGPKCLFKSIHGMSKQKRRLPQSEVATIYVTTYYDQVSIPAQRATYVYGSDVLGPMGRELVPHPSRAEAEEFLRDHHGRGIVRFDEITPEFLRSM